MTRRRLGVLLAGVLLAGAVFAWWWRQPDSVAWVKVEARTEQGSVGQLAGAKEVFASHRADRFTKTLRLDLSKWAGQLLRVDLSSGLTHLSGGARPGAVGWAARLVGPAGERPLRFLGWQNEGKARLHHGVLGPVSFRGPTRAHQDFATGQGGALWHVLAVQPGDQLELTFTPVFPGDLPTLDEPYLPPMPKPWQAAQALPTGARRPDVFIYLLDALRPDHMGCYGYGRPTTPALDAFATSATIYDQAYATTSWTRCSVASIFTGLAPLAHGVMYLDSDKLDAWPVTMAEALGAVGYETMFLPINGQISEYWGFTQGFRHYRTAAHAPGTWAVARATEMLAAADPARSVFMYVHAVDPHVPYAPRPETRRRFDRRIPSACDGSLAFFDQVGLIHPKVTPTDVQHLMDLYDGDIADGDAAFAQFLALLKRTGRFDNSLIIVLADHGEAFTEHDTLTHGRTLNVEDVRVPLLIHYPRGAQAGKRVAARASLVDLYPTVMAATGARPALPYGLPGRDLAGLGQARAREAARPMFAELSSHRGDNLDLVSVLDEDGYRRVVDLSLPPRRAAAASLGLWDTKTDPREQVDLRAKLPVRAAYAEQLLAEYLVTQRWWRGAASTNTTATAPLTEEMRRHLEALGYMGKGRE